MACKVKVAVQVTDKKRGIDVTEIKYREYTDADYESLVDIVDTTWSYTKDSGEKRGRLLAEQDLLDVLKNQTFSRIAVLGEKPVGFIFGRLMGKPSNERYQARIDEVEHLSSQGFLGSIYHRVDTKFKKINDKFLLEAGKDYGAELSFFALTEECQGQGIGKALYQMFLAYAQSQGVTDYFLYTDTASNFGFYEHFGMKRRCSKKVGIPFIKKLSIEFYLYDGKIK